MITRRISAALFVASLAVSVGLGTRHFNSQRTPILNADGGRPVPPVPNASLAGPAGHAVRMLEADGGRPIPPVPSTVAAGMPSRMAV
jgi:hypothetical protein